MNKRGAYFFVVDALIAGAVIVATLMFLFSSVQSRPDSNPTMRSLEEYVRFLSSTKIREHPSSYITTMIADGNITNLDSTLLEQVTEWYYRNPNDGRIRDFMNNVSKGVVTGDRSVFVYINGSEIYNMTVMPLNKSNLLISSKRIIFKKMNESLVFGPTTLEVKIWA